jgi:hypothetical protein
MTKRSLSAGEEEDFRRSLDSYGFAMSMRDELPDGMPQELGEAVQDISNGSRPKDWTTDQKLSFTESVKEIFSEYGFGW